MGSGTVDGREPVAVALADAPEAEGGGQHDGAGGAAGGEVKMLDATWKRVVGKTIAFS